MAHTMTQIQVRIDARTKKAARAVLEDLGLDLSTAIKMFCKHIERTQSVPFDLSSCKHPHKFTCKKAAVLRKAIRESKQHGKKFSSVQALMKDLYS